MKNAAIPPHSTPQNRPFLQAYSQSPAPEKSNTYLRDGNLRNVEVHVCVAPQTRRRRRRRRCCRFGGEARRLRGSGLFATRRIGAGGRVGGICAACLGRLLKQVDNWAVNRVPGSTSQKKIVLLNFLRKNLIKKLLLAIF